MSSARPPVQVAKTKTPGRRKFPWNRSIHRIGAFVAVLLMLWLGGTGSTIQVLDLNATLSHLPPTDPTALSIVEGMYGPGNYAVIQVSDFNAPSLPEGFDFKQGMQTLLRAADTSVTDTRSDDGTSLNPVSWLELRMLNGAPVGQVMRGSDLRAYDARTGAAVQSVQPSSIPQGRRLPYSLRQKLKTLHRFWNRNDTPGVYFEFLSGLVLWLFLITGLLMYFELLKARWRIKRRQLFWLTGGTWRGLHRAISLIAAVFLICMAFSGTWIGYESSYMALGRPKPGTGAPPGMQPATPIDEDQVVAMTAKTLEALRQQKPGMPIKVLRLRSYGQMKQGAVILGGANTEQIVFNAETGEVASLTEPSYPKSGFPFGVQVHENIKHFHSGEMFGLPGQAMNLFAGLSLLFLSISGVVVYADMYLRRHKTGRAALIWKV